MKAWIAALVLVVAAMDASACSCASTPLSQKIDDARFVGIVRVEAVRLRPRFQELRKQAENSGEWWRPILADFVPVQVFKGNVAEFAVLTTEFEDEACGIQFVPGYDYLVIGDPASGELNVNICSGSEALSLLSLLEPPSKAERWFREHPLVAAVRRQIVDGTRVPACLDNNPRRQRVDCDADAGEGIQDKK